MRACRAAALLLLAAASLVLAGCSDDEGADDAVSSTSVQESSDRGQSEEPAVVSVESLGLGEEQLSCVREALPDDVDEQQVPSELLSEAAGGCVRGSEFGSAFADRLADENPGRYSPEQLSCLGEAYGDLSNDDVRVLVAIGFAPQSSSSNAERILGELFGTCDAEMPG
jgi:hypothetical protein